MAEKTNLRTLKDFKEDDFNIFFKLLNKKESSNDKYRNNLPVIPQIYFNDKSSIIDQYYKIKVKLNKLQKTKELLFYILNSEKEAFEKFTVSREKNNLFIRNLLPEFIEAKKYILVNKSIQDIKKLAYDKIHKARNYVTKTPGQVAAPGQTAPGQTAPGQTAPGQTAPQDIPAIICSFLNKFKEKRGILKNSAPNQSHAFEIFNNEYYGKYRKYFIKIFTEYENLRADLFNEIDGTNFGIMAFEYFFDLSFLDKQRAQREQLLKKLSITKPNNSEYNKINYNKYVYANNNTVNNAALEEEEDKKSKVFMKINEYNILYINSNNIAYIKSSYKLKIKNLYRNINNSIDVYIGKKVKNNLYDILKSAIDTDFFLINFLCNYIDPDSFNKVIDNDFKIKKYIYKKISTFENYYDQYKEWFRTIDQGQNMTTDSFGKLIDFDTFYKTKFQEFFPPPITSNK